MITIFGIKNCSTMKKTFDWFAQHALAYQFHDYKKSGIDPAELARWAAELGWEALLNTRGTTWRGLSEAERAGIDAPRALALMAAKPSLIKRPVIDTGKGLLLGYDETRLSLLLNKD